MNVSRETLRELLLQGCAEMKLELQSGQIDKLLAYLDLLQKWNKTYNLTALRDPLQMLSHHLLDSLAVVPAFAHAKRVLDVGAGAGLPGLVLAIVYPQMVVELIDTVQKKTAFMNQVKLELGLSKVTIHTGRVEKLHVKQAYDVITSRAFADLADFVNWSGHLLAQDGQFIALKGLDPEQEKQALPAAWRVSKVEPVHVAQLDAARHLVYIQRNPE